MNKYTKISFGCYMVTAIIIAYLGIRDILALEIRPQHLEIIGVDSWASVVANYKVMLLVFMKGAGLGYLTTALIIAFLLYGPFRNNEKWSIWGLAIVSVIQLGGRWLNLMRASYPHSLPIEVLAIVSALFLIGFLCSLTMTEAQTVKYKDGKYPIISIVCYTLAALMGVITAWVYMSSKQAMAYHLDALSVSSWSMLEAGYQALMLTYMRGAGLGFLTVAVGSAVFLTALMKKPDKWLRWGLLLFTVVHILGMISIVMYVRFNTPGLPPIIPLSIASVLVVIGFFVPLKKNEPINDKIDCVVSQA